MKLEFSAKEIEEILIEKANALGIKANKCEIDIRYSELKSASLSYEEPQAPNDE